MNIIEAIEQENLEQIKLILADNPKQINSKDENGIWCGLLAALTGNSELVKFIVEYSMSRLETVDDNNNNMLHYAVAGGSLEVVRYLVEQVGMDILYGNKTLETPYELADRLAEPDKYNKYRAISDYMEKKCSAKLSDMYKNPVRTGAFPDPSIVRVEEDYYMVNSSFIYFPCIPISHSRDLINWEIIGHAITNPKWSRLGDLEGGRGYWAPDISYNNGRFYITATYRLNDDGPVYRKQMVTSSDKPEGPYDEPVFIDEDGIDPSIFTDDDGKRYMLLNRGVRIFEISEDGKRKISQPRLIWYGDCKIATEGPHLIHYNDYYYLFVAEGGTGLGHRISVGRSKNLMGPYESCPYNPIMRQTDEKAVIQRAGHGKPVQTQNGDWYMVYLCARPIDGKYTVLGRETALDKITWTKDGWPIVNDLKGPSVLQKKPDLPRDFDSLNIDRKSDTDGEITFGSEKLSNNWMFSREMIEGQVSVNNGVLKLRGNRDDLHTTDCRSFVLTRQTDVDITASCKVKWDKLSNSQNIGMTCYYDENSYIKYGVFGELDGYYLKICEWADDKYINIQQKILDKNTKQIELMTVAKGLDREFMYCIDGVTWENMCHLKNVTYLSDEGLQKGKRFTGAMIGVYVHAGEMCEVEGQFLQFKLKNN